jgi:hypothetical protein
MPAGPGDAVPPEQTLILALKFLKRVKARRFKYGEQ